MTVSAAASLVLWAFWPADVQPARTGTARTGTAGPRTAAPRTAAPRTAGPRTAGARTAASTGPGEVAAANSTARPPAAMTAGSTPTGNRRPPARILDAALSPIAHLSAPCGAGRPPVTARVPNGAGGPCCRTPPGRPQERRNVGYLRGPPA